MMSIPMINQDVLDYCKEMLVKVSNVEHVQLRNIVSRAYYFAYYETIYHAEKRLDWPVTTSKGGVHAKAISRLKGFPEDLEKEKRQLALALHSQMNTLKKLRTRADYKLDQPIARTVSQYAVKEVEVIAIKLSAL